MSNFVLFFGALLSIFALEHHSSSMSENELESEDVPPQPWRGSPVALGQNRSEPTQEKGHSLYTEPETEDCG